MTSKQAHRSKQKKAQKRKKQLALRRPTSIGGDFSMVPDPWAASAQGAPHGVLSTLGITPDDYLPDGKLKVSAALLAMAQPMIDEHGITSREVALKVLTVAMAAWNMEVGESMGQDAAGLQRAMEAAMPADLHDDLRSMLAYFRNMKRSVFPDDHRMLVNLDVVGRDGHWRVNVASMALKP